jgi:hypothetical protein
VCTPLFRPTGWWPGDDDCYERGDGHIVIVSSVLLVLVSAMTMVIGARDASMRVALISMGCALVSAAVLVMSVRARTAAWDRDDEAVAEQDAFRDAPLPSSRPGHAAAPTGTASQAETGPPAAPGRDPVGTAESAPGPTPAAPPSRPAPTPAAPPSGPNVVAPGASSVLETVLGLQAPGPGVLGRLRRPPLVGSATPRASLATRADDSRANGRRPGGEACAVPRQPKSVPASASAGPRKQARTRGAGEGNASVRPAPNRSAPAKQARPREKAGKR